MKMKEFRPRGGRPWRPLRSANVYLCLISETSHDTQFNISLDKIPIKSYFRYEVP